MPELRQGQGALVPARRTQSRRLDGRGIFVVLLRSAGLLWVLATAGRRVDAFVSPLRPSVTPTLSLKLLCVDRTNHEGNVRHGMTTMAPTAPRMHSGPPCIGSKAHQDGKCRSMSTDDDYKGLVTRKVPRAVLTSLLSVMLLGVVVQTMTMGPEPAHATYSAYARREQDWSDRTSTGQVQYSSARALKKQLREIAPMNTAKSLLFCPNGPSSNVSPLMENRCGDQLATPSVFGRTEDVVGNSIPGFSSRPASGVDDGLLTPASVGGFLPYGSK